MNIEDELRAKFSEPFLAGLKENVDEIRSCTFLLKNTEKLYELCIRDKYLDYPFFKDMDCDQEKGILAEHERVENFIYSINILYFNAYCHLFRLIKDYLGPFREHGITPQSIVDVGLVLLPGDFMINLCSSLDALSLLVAFIQGYPINVHASNMKQIMLLLENIEGREESVFAVDSLRMNIEDISSLSADARNMSRHLITEVSPLIIADDGKNWLEEIYDYRNYFAHKNFRATVIKNRGEVYLPKNPNILPSVVLNADSQVVMSYCHTLPLDELCIDRYKRTRGLIEKSFQCLLQTYEWRLNNPDKIINPHKKFRRLNSYT